MSYVVLVLDFMRFDVQCTCIIFNIYNSRFTCKIIAFIFTEQVLFTVSVSKIESNDGLFLASNVWNMKISSPIWITIVLSHKIIELIIAFLMSKLQTAACGDVNVSESELVNIELIRVVFDIVVFVFGQNFEFNNAEYSWIFLLWYFHALFFLEVRVALSTFTSLLNKMSNRFSFLCI